MEAGRKKRKRLDQDRRSQSSLNSRKKPGRVKMIQLKYPILQNPAHIVHPKRCVLRLNIRVFPPEHVLFPACPCPLTGIAVAVRSK